MVAPTSGTYSKTITLKGPPTSFGYKPTWLAITRRWNRQRKPYNLPLPYSLDSRKVTSFTDTDGTAYKDTSNVWYGVPQDFVDNTYNRAYAKFIDKLHDTADMATNLAEHEQTKEMITTRVVQLLKFTRSIRRFDIRGAYQALGMAVPKYTHRFSINKRNAKAFGNTWLEFHFGWEPLVKDIKSGIDIITSGLPPWKIKCGRRATLPNVRNNTWSITHGTTNDTTYHEGFTLGSQISVTNPNLWLAGRLGVLNPAALAWELVPFSFVLDWFVNLNDVIASYSDFFGLTLVNPYRTEFRTVVHAETEFWATGTGNVTRYRSFASEFVAVGRSLGIPGPTLRVRPAKALSWQRGLTAASLLVQSLKG